jgi:Undecaprenyl-phosphate glucose phosphotransferase
MSTMTGHLLAANPLRAWTTLTRNMVTVGAILADAAVIIAVAVLMGAIYHLAAYGDSGPWASFFEIGCVATSIFVLPSAIHGDYALPNYLTFKPHVRRVFTLWNVTFLCLLTLGFLAKMTDVYSRGTMILFYAGGLPAILLARYALVQTVLLGSRLGLVSAQRVFLIGGEDDIATFLNRYEPWNFGLYVVAAAPLSPVASAASPATRRSALQIDLKRAIDLAREQRPDAVYIVVPWSQTDTIDRCVEEFLTIPAEIHLSPEPILDRFDHVRIAKLGPMASLQLTRAPLSALEVLQKRAFDIVASAAALVAFAPLFVLVAILIKLGSAGPVFFLQRRYGFNQQPFRIIKFRTMTALDDGDVVLQAKHHDPRITWIGRWLRRTNIDELPQLINVLKGDMSLVGPRPHALSHNREFEQKISLYARRHNVSPGMTGWAQVNGLRGETDTDDKMRRRVGADLYYIDNWSMWLDLRIIFLTVFSRGAYRNAL